MDGTSESFRDWHISELKDSDKALKLLNIAMCECQEEDGDKGFLPCVLRDITEAQGGVEKLANLSELDEQDLYSELNGLSELKLLTVLRLMHALGFGLDFKLA